MHPGEGGGPVRVDGDKVLCFLVEIGICGSADLEATEVIGATLLYRVGLWARSVLVEAEDGRLIRAGKADTVLVGGVVEGDAEGDAEGDNVMLHDDRIECYTEDCDCCIELEHETLDWKDVEEFWGGCHQQRNSHEEHQQRIRHLKSPKQSILAQATF